MNIKQKISLIGFFIGLAMVASMSFYTDKYIMYVVILGFAISLSCALAYSLFQYVQTSTSSSPKKESSAKGIIKGWDRSSEIETKELPQVIKELSRLVDYWPKVNPTTIESRFALLFPLYSTHSKYSSSRQVMFREKYEDYKINLPFSESVHGDTTLNPTLGYPEFLGSLEAEETKEENPVIYVFNKPRKKVKNE